MYVFMVSMCVLEKIRSTSPHPITNLTQAMTVEFWALLPWYIYHDYFRQAKQSKKIRASE